LQETRPGIPYAEFIEVNKALQGNLIEDPKKKDD
jgi:hypothetical protein